MSDLQFGTIMLGLLAIWFGVASLESDDQKPNKAAFFSGLMVFTAMGLTLAGLTA